MQHLKMIIPFHCINYLKCMSIFLLYLYMTNIYLKMSVKILSHPGHGCSWKVESRATWSQTLEDDSPLVQEASSVAWRGCFRSEERWNIFNHLEPRPVALDSTFLWLIFEILDNFTLLGLKQFFIWTHVRSVEGKCWQLTDIWNTSHN